MNIKQSLRIVFRNKTYSILNIMGLAIGIACAALILLWVEDEVTYNDFPKEKQLYAVYQNQSYNNGVFTFKVAPNPLSAALKDEVAGIRNVMRYQDNNKSLFSLNDKMIYETGAYTDSTIFSMLDITVVKGDAKTAFDAAYPLIITEEMALRFFGKDDPIGQTLKKDNGQEYQVTAVIRKPKANSDFSFAWLIPFEQLVKDMVASGWQTAGTEWGSNWMTDYVELEASADVSQINGKILNMLKEKKNNPNDQCTLFIYPIGKTKLYGEFKDGVPTGSGYVRYVRLFFWIAVVILIIACINFMNLSTARSQKRVLEVGVRKTFGAGRLRLVGQFLSETGVITIIALLLSIILIAIIIYPFNQLTGKELTLGLGNAVHWMGLLGIGLICSVMAGSYPAFFLSSFPPIDVLRKLTAKSGAGVVWLRQGLVVFQFTVSLTLIICTAFIYLQVQHTRNRSMGMNVEQVVIAQANQDIRDHFEALRQELLSTGEVEHVGLSTQTMLNIGNNGWGWKWDGKAEDIDFLISNGGISTDLFPTLNITFH
ncbi:MAG: ABC transporter permease, partial [Tannerella sp.]|nr:ABC transporter permease [Tannerella sp.]